MVTKQSKRVIDWRIRTKEKIVASMGGCCQICKYDRCNSALELHHIDPNEKELSFSSIRANPKSIDKIIEELKKCILLCANCHREVHAGLIVLPELYSVLDENLMRHYRKSDSLIAQRESTTLTL
jgi:hypothetical protein